MEYLDIDAVPLEVTGCVRIRDLAPLLSGSEVRGSDVLIPGIDGVLPQLRRTTVTIVALELMVFAFRDFAGDPHSDARSGLWSNVAYLLDNVMASPGGDGTRTATLHWPDGTTETTADVHVIGPLDLSADGPNKLRGVLRLSFPYGAFDLAAVGS